MDFSAYFRPEVARALDLEPVFDVWFFNNAAPFIPAVDVISLLSRLLLRAVIFIN